MSVEIQFFPRDFEIGPNLFIRHPQNQTGGVGQMERAVAAVYATDRLYSDCSGVVNFWNNSAYRSVYSIAVINRD
jgi:hypothetical protein